MTTTAEFIAGFEGYAGRAYWDVNAWRIGYGSDTEGPDQVHVTEGMETTKARALQNLALRIPEFQTKAIYGKTGVGVDVWEKLTEHQKSAITSLVYNYGRLPIVVTISDPGKTAAAIKGLQNANGGVNRERRLEEAKFYLTPDIMASQVPSPVPAPQAPATYIPIPATPPSAAPAGLPQISSTTAGLDAAILDRFGEILDALTKQRDAISVRIAKIQAQAAEFAALEGTAPTQLPKPSTPKPPDEPPAQPQGPTTMQAIFTNILTSWATSALGGVAGGPSVIDVIQNPGNWQHDLPGIATVLLGFVAKDGWVTGGTKQAPVSK